MKNFLYTFLFLGLCLGLNAQVQINTGYQISTEESKGFFVETELSFRVDVDKNKNLKDAEIGFLIGARYGFESTFRESVSFPQGDYLFGFVRGYFPLLGIIKGTALIEYDFLNDRFNTSPGLFLPLNNQLSLNLEGMFGLWGSAYNEYAGKAGIRTVLKFRMGK